MPVIGLVGLPGSGKTLRAVELAMMAREAGRDVYANFRLGRREDAYLLPKCPAITGRDAVCWTVDGPMERGLTAYDDPYPHAWHQPVEDFVAPVRELDATTRRLYDAAGFRRGRAFIVDPGAFVLSSWEQVLALKVARDALDKPHRLKLELRGVKVGPDGPEEDWVAVPTCVPSICLARTKGAGCSKGLTIVLDELNLWAPSRFWQKLGIGVLNRWAYVRKDGMYIIWTAQHEGRIDVVARQVTDFIWTCRSFGPVWFGRWKLQLFNRRKWMPAMLTDANRTGEQEGAKAQGAMGMDFEWSFFHQRYADGYDTFEHVGAIAITKAQRVAATAGRTPAAAAPRAIGTAPRAPRKPGSRAAAHTAAPVASSPRP